ncbi:hypothetical protein INS49_002210 [Diaporthe citri]|uniref:uncharacterized protein n=1 Tax=Diaporthe citri TaxID=83186 RepID=UPI001C7F39F3|nr:uncharacterized protein INS49_002210 [Diaporthe citri]KAG6368010.1 hypothetical protein INS49_002210 [Diaporthe citri]
MDAVQDFNSSDLEFDDNPIPAAAGYRRPGQASINKMIANTRQDRISSKKTIKQLQFQAAAPSTQKFQALWA